MRLPGEYPCGKMMEAQTNTKKVVEGANEGNEASGDNEEMVSKVVEAVGDYLGRNPTEIKSLGYQVEEFESICRAAESRNVNLLSFRIATAAGELQIVIRDGEPEVNP